MSRQIVARFHPQAWVNDYAVEVDAEGPTEWDVTATIVGMGRDEALALADDTYPTDDLRHTDNCPEWIRDWGGPFWIEVADAIRDYYEVEGGGE